MEYHDMNVNAQSCLSNYCLSANIKLVLIHTVQKRQEINYCCCGRTTVMQELKQESVYNGYFLSE